MRGAGLNFNAVLYACCRDPAMCEKALRVWDDMAEQGVPPELEPMSKLMLSCLARGRFDDSFRIFLAAIDAASASASRSAAASSSKPASAPLYPLAQLDALTDDFLAAASVCLPDAEYQELAGGFVSIRWSRR